MPSFPPRRVVVAVDFGEASLAAVRAAGVLARRLAAPLVAVHAESLETPPYFTTEQIDAIEHQREAARRDAERYLARIAGREAGTPVTAIVREGRAADLILDTVTEGDLLVLGTHGRRGPSRWWLGSVAERVAAAGRVPTLVLHASDRQADGYAEVVYIAGPDATPGDAAWAADLARALGAALDTIEAADRERLLRTCTRPVLFLPDSGTSEGTPS
ncbi:MAG: universal stress protein [Vicinamibacterales bacterium]